MTQQTRDHGGNLDAAIQDFGGAPEDWIDLSTGINPVAYPVPPIRAEAWAILPRKSDMARLMGAARVAYGTKADIVALAGAQGAIQAVPFLRAPGLARVLTPTYNEHAAALRMGGWTTQEVPSVDALTGAELAVVVNPNNPDGLFYTPEALRDLAGQVGLLVVDESFGDPAPELSLAGQVHELDNVLILRSFGKFYGLAGVRLGFALGAAPLVDCLREMAGPWPVSGPAIDIACAALADTDWQAETIARLTQDAARLDALAQGAGWTLIGGTPLFRTYHAPDAAEAQNALAKAHIWSRIFPYSPNWVRLGLAGTEPEWHRLTAAFNTLKG
ncbi:threonine-phosphate decarboxylase CobD [Tropicibacter naphthalenivorans]|uniref:threonine-phosphate decarboxylase n=1 Tax=Tropicibacter naphthalenivorans TaxID=441103 RepID=A0A0P1H1N8_9RHOB|nr:threonine-phosphate decarboxylase CobD [Tropicibacter naphthalenivorans]CUH80842.1 Histidinol-phosphate aminotransferase [Tropicibacter naphthalenivorans]SMC90531.1 L-threonine O-3-phosphate decarboxylase [Tropicibacter naphthalenivorans]